MIIRHDFGAPGARNRAVHGGAHSAAGIRGMIVGLDAVGPNITGPLRWLWRHMPVTGFLSLTREGFRAIAPSTVVSPLIAEGHDALEIARHLAGLGFCGEYRIIAPNLPDYALVRREIGDAAPLLNCRIIGPGGLARLLDSGG